MRKTILTLASLAVTLAVAAPSQARDTRQHFDIATALEAGKADGTLDGTAGGQTLLKERPLVISFKLAAIKLLKSQTRGADFVALAALLTERGVAKGGPPRSFWGILVYKNNSDEEKCLKK